MDERDDMKNPDLHTPPTKSLVDKVIDLALGAGGGAVTLLSGLLAAVLILYSGYVLYDSFTTEQRAASSTWDLLQFKPEIFDDYETPLSSSELADINQDYRAWLTVYGTSIDYPVVQGENDLYYASHDIYNRVSLTGAIYLAAGNRGDFSDSYNVIYGHHMDNGAMFGGLDGMSGSETGVIVTDEGIYDVQFFAVISTDAYESRIYSVGNRMNDVLAFLRSGGEGGVGVGTTVTYFNEAAAADAEKLVALSTCANANTSGRLVVIGKMTKHIVMKDITVKKVWDDADDQDGVRPDSIAVVASDGTEATLTAEDGWTVTVSVRKFDSRGEITYHWEERPVSGYTLTGNVTEGDETVLTNRHEPAVKSVTVKKVWNDDDNRDGLRPDTVTAVLSNGQTVELNASNGWTAMIDQLPVYDHGEEIEYTWTENDVPGYTLTVQTEGDTTTLTNAHELIRTEKTVTVVWVDQNDQDGIRPQSVKVTLYGNGDAPVGEVTLSEANGWTATLTGLLAYENGDPIPYRWVEEDIFGYTADYAVEGDATTITNTHAPATKALTVSKVWDDNDDQDGIRPGSLQVELSNGQFVTLHAENGWTATLEGLPVNSQGEAIEYSWLEDVVSGYTLTGVTVNGDTTILTNRHETDTTVATVTKVWDDDNDRDGLRPASITATLSNGESVTLSEENGWTATVTGLPLNANGQTITYTWTEQPVDGYTAQSTVSGTTTTIVNRHSAAKTASTVRKVWNDANDQDGLRPAELAVTLLANGEPIQAAALTAAGGWTATVNDLPANEAGVPIEYTWTEQDVPGYTLSAGADSDAYVLTNTHVPETMSLTVRIAWNDANDQDGIRPDTLAVTLSGNGEPIVLTLTAEDGWTATVNDLPVYQNGERIRYTWTEEDIEGYTLTDTSAEGNVTTLTNTHVPDVKSLTVQKVWEDDNDRDRIRPSILEVRLLANGETVRTVSLNSANGWRAAVDNLPVNEGGTQIEYTWNEAEVEGYVLTTQTDGNVTTLTNTHEVEKLTLSVKKVWDDDDDRDGIRPESLTVTLTGDNGSTQEVILTAENEWTATVSVPANERGQAVSYAWSEESVRSYTNSSTEQDGDTTVFTNAHAPATTSRVIMKEWQDDDNRDGVRPESITFYLLANDEPIQTILLNEDNEWTYTAENLYVYDHGETIRYSWREDSVEEYPYFNTSTNANVTTYTNRHLIATTSLTITKVWEDEDNRNGLRPGSVTVNLMAGDQPAEGVEPVILSEENNWTATVEGLPVNADGQRIEYTWVEDAVDGYTSSAVTTGTSTVLTNTHENILRLTVVKVWDDDNNRDGLRPEELAVTLNANGEAVLEFTLNEENDWTVTSDALPVYADGEEIEYTWTEEAVENYTGEMSVEGTVTTFVNTHEIATASRSVTKVWDDDNNRDGLRPTELTVSLNAGAGFLQNVTLRAATGWTATVDDLPVNEGGQPIVYSWTEYQVPGYELTNTEVRTTPAGVVATTLTNTHAPETIDLTVVKRWVDTDANARPGSINMVLTGGGETRIVNVNAANDWTGVAEGLLRNANGQAIEYTWTEPNVPGYTQTDVSTDGTTTTFTNTRNEVEDDTEYTLTITYRFADGRTAAPTYEGVYHYGDAYNVASPAIAGYRPTLVRVTGTMPRRNVEYAVIYIANDESIIEDFETPLGLGNGQVFLNIDDCID